MNPFVVGTYISKEYFCDRRVETESLEEHVRNGRNVVLFSERSLAGEIALAKAFNLHQLLVNHLS